jgi:gold/copper resistance efflux system membrane fusion protein
MSRRVELAALPLLALLAFPACFGGGKGPAAQPSAAAAPPEVLVAEVLVRSRAETAELTGTLSSPETVALKPRLAGFVESVGYEEGGRVTRGQVLFRLDRRPLVVALAHASAARSEANAQVALAEREHARVVELRAGGVATDRELDGAVAAHALAQARVEAARAAVQTAEIQLGYAEVRSPIDGLAGSALVTAGNLVSGGTGESTLLTTVVSIDPLWVDFDVDEATYRKLLAAHPSGEALDTVGVRVAVGADGDFGLAGTLDVIGPSLDPGSGTARLRAVVPNPDGQLRPGMFARVRLDVGEARPTVLVRDEAIHTDPSGRAVLVVGEDGTVQQRIVELGGLEANLRVVERGLEPGERVAIRGPARPGAQVTPKAVAMNPAEVTP